jgi:hypothetical protein
MFGVAVFGCGWLVGGVCVGRVGGAGSPLREEGWLPPSLLDMRFILESGLGL